jgi:hypothetical protein
VVLRRLLISARSSLIGWATLFVLVFLVVRPILSRTAPLLGPSWFQTARVVLECTALAATGWVIGRASQSRPTIEVLVFAATLTVWDFGQTLSVNIPWLLRLALNTFGDARYLDSLITIAATQTFLFGSLIAGGMLSRRSRGTPVSIFGSENAGPADARSSPEN